jgi:hypothetical protein
VSGRGAASPDHESAIDIRAIIDPAPIPPIVDRKRISTGAFVRRHSQSATWSSSCRALEENAMSVQNLAKYTVAALGGATMLALTLSPASAFTLAAPSLEAPVASAQIDKVWWHGGWGGHHGWGGGWGWHHGYGWGGGYAGPGWGGGYAGPNCWRGYWGHLHCNY